MENDMQTFLFGMLLGVFMTMLLFLNDSFRQWWTGVDKATELDELFGDWAAGKTRAGSDQLDKLADAVSKKIGISQ
jgi:hypothetical protein